MDRIRLGRGATAGPRERLLGELATGAAPRGFRIAYDLLGNRAEAEDAVQEALARVCERFDQLRDPAMADAWFRRVLVTVCLQVLRRRRLRRVVSLLVPGSAEPPSDAIAEDLPGADQELAQQGDTRRLMRALERLPAKQRAALVLRYGQDLSVGEVAEMLGVGQGTAKTHLVRGLKRLRALMEKSHDQL
ncbi:MAG TPA: sigma-70 family RNA polymerase sigma factor [Kofleriaceae bacterium]|nr:sigma-70 family RNA polymerase sigma factor [Kofleriaceae bacterium]